MEQQEKPVEQHRQLKEYGEWLLSELEKQGVKLSITNENALHIKGEITTAQKEHIRLWKRWLIEAISPHCSNCRLPMCLIENGTLWFCPFGCESQKIQR
ncbi:MAG TPA: hypothetical protein VNI84_00925 [Pyrinomonadaceae bacterium]|nr:hypothetical protein [Pyrinomonadaceae bacterium]